eukprot:CAMPEP_0172700564 /NCGR_PEP_ID=MMETSP1074-20121228/30997_1 /TAXON_ID=2916 /ORGANISM="Ceratium fusus, Strain PA161109" /LENGTH=61 /DNA_ID=CAMNT_0013521959 /DNA_START=181 /DNA_END=362 /DNA_ORIENTATION=-
MKARVSFGSIVQKGKFSAAAWCDLLKELYKVLFPTLGMPTRPTLRLLENFPKHHAPGFSST